MSLIRKKGKPRILVVTPEITYLPDGMGNLAHRANAKAGGLADVSASLVAALFEQGADVHVALPHYRRMFHMDVGQLISDELRVYQNRLASDRVHLAEDRCFYYRERVYSRSDEENPRLALAFQREVINNIIPTVDPDLIHCNDWMTGLIPAAARRLGIPCLFTVHNIHTHKLTLAQIEDAGIDAAEFWGNLYYSRPPYNYFESRDTNFVDLQASTRSRLRSCGKSLMDGMTSFRSPSATRYAASSTRVAPPVSSTRRTPRTIPRSTTRFRSSTVLRTTAR